MLIWYSVDEQLPTCRLIGAVQAVLVLFAILIRKDFIKISWQGLDMIAMGFALGLMIPFVWSSDHDQMNSYYKSISKEEYRWPGSGMAQMLPDPISDYGRIYEDNDLEFRVELHNVSETRYRSYVKACIRKGFDDINYEFDDSFSALNADGYDLYLWLSMRGDLNITLSSPKQLTYIEWPDNEMLMLLPEPEDVYGRVDADRSGYCAVCLGRFYEDTYKEYVRACREAGFTRNYERTADTYEASDEEGNRLLLDWSKDNSMMYIQIWSGDFLASMESTQSVSEIESESAADEEQETEDNTSKETDETDETDEMLTEEAEE